MRCVRWWTNGLRGPRQALRQFATFGIQAELAPYCADPQTFLPLARERCRLAGPETSAGIACDAYLIGNFHSDTAFTLGSDRPKWQKGPDIFAEIVRQVARSGAPCLRPSRRPSPTLVARALEKPERVLFFLLAANWRGTTLPATFSTEQLNRLYNLLDFYLVCSRWEGGPHSILEACFSKTKILSTRVGIAEDVLEEVSLFDTMPEAVSRISDDIRHRTLDATREAQYRTVLTENNPERLAEAMRRIYGRFPQEPPKKLREAARTWLRAGTRARFRRRAEPPAIIGLLGGRSPGVLFDFLRQALRQSGAVVLSESIAGNCRHYLADENWLSSSDARKPADRKVAMVSDHPASKASRLADAMVVPSFKAVDAARQIGLALPSLVIPPAVDGMSFDPRCPCGSN